MIQFFLEPIQTVLIGVLGIILVGLALFLVAAVIILLIGTIRFTLYKCGWVKESYWHELKRRDSQNEKQTNS